MLKTRTDAPPIRNVTSPQRLGYEYSHGDTCMDCGMPVTNGARRCRAGHNRYSNSKRKGEHHAKKGNSSNYLKAALYNGAMTHDHRRQLGATHKCVNYGRWPMCVNCTEELPAECPALALEPLDWWQGGRDICEVCGLQCPCKGG